MCLSLLEEDIRGVGFAPGGREFMCSREWGMALNMHAIEYRFCEACVRGCVLKRPRGCVSTAGFSIFKEGKGGHSGAVGHC